MSSRGAPPQQLCNNVDLSQPIFNVDPGVEGVKSVNLKQALEELYANETNGLPNQTRLLFAHISSTIEDLINIPEECEYKIDPTFWMRSASTQPQWEEKISKLPDPGRKSEVDKILIQNVDLINGANDSRVHLGVCYDGLRGRDYEGKGEKQRFTVIIPAGCTPSHAPGEFCVHKPTLTSAQIVAASFSDVSKQDLYREFGPKAGAEGVSHLIHSPYSRILDSMEEFTNGLDPMVCASYDIDPMNIPYVQPRPDKNHKGLFEFPTSFLQDQVAWILSAQKKLSSLNPVVSADGYTVRFLPADCKNWKEFKSSKLYQVWEKQGPAYLAERLREPVQFSSHVLITFLANDDITRKALGTAEVELEQD